MMKQDTLPPAADHQIVTEFEQKYDVYWSLDSIDWNETDTVKINTKGQLIAINTSTLNSTTLINNLQDCKINLSKYTNDSLRIKIDGFNKKTIYLRVSDSTVLNKLLDCLLVWSSFKNFGIFNKLIYYQETLSSDQSIIYENVDDCKYSDNKISQKVNIKILTDGLLRIYSTEEEGQNALLKSIDVRTILESQIDKLLGHNVKGIIIYSNEREGEELKLQFISMADYTKVWELLYKFTIKSYYSNKNEKIENYLKLSHSFKINIIEAKLEPESFEGDFSYYCSIQLSEDLPTNFKTTTLSNYDVLDNSTLFWRESFSCDKSVNIDTLKLNLIKINNETQHCNTIGSAIIYLNKLTDIKSLQRLPLKSEDSTNNQIGDICFQVEYMKKNILINSMDPYKNFEKNLKNTNMSDILSYITQRTSNLTHTELIEISVPLIDAFQCLGKENSWLQSLMNYEIMNITVKLKSTDNASAIINTIFRGNSLLTISTEYLFNMTGKIYLVETMRSVITDILNTNEVIELDENRLRKTYQGKTNKSMEELISDNKLKLSYWVEKIWKNLYTTIEKMPIEIKKALKSLKTSLEEILISQINVDRGTKEKIILNSISSFLFLRYLCPILLNPNLFGITNKIPNENVRRTLTLITKVLLHFSTLTHFGNKEPWMLCMNDFIDDNNDDLHNFIDKIVNTSNNSDGNGGNIKSTVDFYEPTSLDLTEFNLIGVDPNTLESNFYTIKKCFKYTDVINLLVTFMLNEDREPSDHIPMSNLSMSTIMSDIPFEINSESCQQFHNDNTGTLSSLKRHKLILNENATEVELASIHDTYSSSHSEIGNMSILLNSASIVHTKIKSLLNTTFQLEYPSASLSRLDPYFIKLTNSTYINKHDSLYIENNPGKDIKTKNYFQLQPFEVKNIPLNSNKYVKCITDAASSSPRSKASRFSRMFLGATSNAPDSEQTSNKIGKWLRWDRH
ncbi:hypothetical protein TPHA_0C03960 [Tetrapisispora phaffii CBS 4417]|uniref:Ras-GAP domain-containing protein n=1 Tax=Tetrapisispora phaffii (strain ATCC 24235 / CBS 4417 / NBRC 1672 / NRRL Y-8282 / UCD 70-5) TaxID=1071381 RepID=G8BQN4_TETPH|nr:hypothetical protein TPHA_0C03960 [Tetrapisispora phaffii CBS 4417]CCE62546.1 hypothetical protein TPHA_0C03960 [Tetrapisispora phaffii CBS 4417]